MTSLLFYVCFGLESLFVMDFPNASMKTCHYKKILVKEKEYRYLF